MKTKKENNIVLKIFICLIYMVIISILFICSYRLFEEKKSILPWDQVESIEDYTYLDIYKMSEKFAFQEETNVGIHFVIQKEENGSWHTYLIAINENQYDRFKAIIDYTYERTTKEPDPIRVYGYPVITSKEMKDLAIKNIQNFLPADNEIIITEENYETYLRNSYLDTTKEKKDKFSILLCISLMLLFTVIALFLLTILDHNTTEEVEEKEEIKNTKKYRQRKQKKTTE